MKRTIVIFMVGIIAMILMTPSIYGHSGNTDIYGGHYIQKDEKCIGYHYHSEFDSGEFDYSGWQLDFDVAVDWNDREKILNDIKPFIPGVNTCLGKWVKVEFDESNEAKCSYEPGVTPSPSETSKPTTTMLSPTVTPSPTEDRQLPRTGESNGYIAFLGFIIAMCGIYSAIRTFLCN